MAHTHPTIHIEIHIDGEAYRNKIITRAFAPIFSGIAATKSMDEVTSSGLLLLRSVGNPISGIDNAATNSR